jgi:hypothetical protein
MRNSCKQLIVFAWAIEIVGVVGGALNSAYTTFGDQWPNSLPAYLPAVPMVAVAVAELGRVPIASVIYNKGIFMRSLAVFGILALGYLAVENWSFGFERIVELRLKPVNIASRELSVAEADLRALENERNQKTKNNTQKREELRQGAGRHDAGIAELTAQLSKEGETHQRNLEQIREACRIIRGDCIRPRSQDEDVRYETEVHQLSAALASLRDERKELQSQIDALVTVDASEAAEFDSKIAAAELVANEKRQAFQRATDGNQIYRLAASWSGVNTSNVTAEQFATARWVFATFSAIAVAIAGSVCALVYYAPSREPGAPSSLNVLIRKVSRAGRAYYARKRKPLVREVPGPERIIYRDGKEPPTVVEKEVPRFIDRIVLIPRFGIRVPTYINSLIGRGGRQPRTSHDRCEMASNVTPLKGVS